MPSLWKPLKVKALLSEIKGIILDEFGGTWQITKDDRGEIKSAESVFQAQFILSEDGVTGVLVIGPGNLREGRP